MNLNVTIIGQGLAFIIFVLFCMKYIWPPIINIIEHRQKEIADGITFAEQAKKKLELAQAQADEQLIQAQNKALSIIKQAEQQRFQIIEAAKIQAEKERLKILTLTKGEIEVQYKNLSYELRQKLAKMIIAGVEKILEHSVNQEIDNNIIEKFISKL
ncbi:MAG: F0F1 ATP synthase subunit B [Candidatus Dasytiphilus stammeri]